MNLRKRFFAVVVSVTLLAPFAASARTVREIVNTGAETVTRANFLSWSVEALGLPKSIKTCTLPYARSPRGLLPTLCLAQSKGALTIFGTAKQYPLSKPITRGEALIVLTALLGERGAVQDVSVFKDIKTDKEKEAVANAIANKWMLPSRTAFFGVGDRLTGTEALSLLQAVTGDIPVKAIQSITITPGQAKTGTLPKQQLLDAIWQILRKDYLHADSIKDDEGAYSAAEALVKSVGDPYTTFFRPASAENFSEQLKGELSGIGAQVEDKSGSIVVVSPIPGSPAERAGILPGDIILQADGHSLTGIGVDRAVQFIRGERGTKVELILRRGGIEITLSIVRDSITLPEIDVKWNGDVAIVQLLQFGETTEKKIRGVFEDVEKQHPRGIILDLRNNGGGLLTAANSVMSNFVPRDTIYAVVESAKTSIDERTEYGPTVAADRKLVVLVNKGSASASEIVAAALQDLKRATIVGTQTFGKGTVQEVLSFPNGEALKVTVAEWLSPLKRHIDQVGVKPDIVIESQDRDEQMRRALDILR